MSAPSASIAAVQKALECRPMALSTPDQSTGWCGQHGIHRGRWADRGCPVAVAAADAAVEAATPGIQAGALRKFADTRGVDVGDGDDAWWRGYRQAQRECLRDAMREADRIEARP